jgi:hypothetical protein
MGADRERLGASRRRRAGLLVALLGSGCAAAPPPSPPSATPSATGLARFLPLEDGTVASFDTVTEPGGERGLLVLEIRRPNPETAELVVAGHASRLRLSTGAVAHAAGGFLLREPLAAGAQWKGDFGHVRVTRTDRSISVGAGTFTGCVETLEELTTREGQKRTTTVFCPGVGIALRETEAEQGAEQQSERITLKSYGPKFDPSTK